MDTRAGREAPGRHRADAEPTAPGREIPGHTRLAERPRAGRKVTADTRATLAHGRPLRSVVRAELAGGSMRVRGTARTLHVAPRDSAAAGGA
jgi:hypothetical protein